MLCGMLKPLKVVPIEEQKNKLIARDVEGRRIIVSVGSQRMAIDYFTTRLPPHTGDQPAPVLPIKKSKYERNNKRK